jgi:hypothetical protein
VLFADCYAHRLVVSVAAAFSLPLGKGADVWVVVAAH